MLFRSASPDRYLAKTIERLPEDPELMRPKANAWAAQVRMKEHGKIALHAMLRMLLGNQVQAGLLWVDFPEGAVSTEVRRTAQLLLDHPTDHQNDFCGTCKAIRHFDWPLAIRLAGGKDAPIILGALIELYRSALQAGLVPIVDGEARVLGVDGVLDVHSPPGGPTTLVAEIPRHGNRND